MKKAFKYADSKLLPSPVSWPFELRLVTTCGDLLGHFVRVFLSVEEGKLGG